MMKIAVATILLLFTSGGISFSLAQDKNPKSKGEITEITLERRGCHGVCPAYKVILRKNGMSEYIGEFGVTRRGKYQAKIFPTDFEQLAKLIESRGYFNLKDKYFFSHQSPGSFATTSVVRGGIRKTIENDEGAIPVELWGIEIAIDGIVETRMPWDKVGGK